MPLARPLTPPRARPATTLDALARTRIKSWLAATGTTQSSLAAAIHRKPAWMSRYLAAEYDTDLETLRAIATVFGRTVSALFDTPDDPEIATLVDYYNALPSSAREIVLSLIRELARDTARPTRQSNVG